MKKRIMYAGICAIGCLIVKITIDVITDNALGLTQRFHNDETAELLIWYNLKYFLQLQAFHPIFINSGTLLLLIVLPRIDNHDLMWKSIAIVFIIGTLITGRINEYRIFHELIPPGLGLLAKTWDKWSMNGELSRNPTGFS